MIVIVIAMTSLTIENNIISKRYSGLKGMYYCTFVSIVITIICLGLGNNFASYPLYLTDLFRHLYFIASPLLALLYFMYAVSIVYNKLGIVQILKKYFYLLIPYFIYLGIIISNPLHRQICTICPENGYLKGPWSALSYYIAFIYLAMLIVFAFIHRKTPQKKVLTVICANFLISTVIFSAQLFLPEIQLSGLGCVTGLLIVHFYVINVSKAMDPLTELNNRQTLTIHLSKMCQSKTPFALTVFSLRNFKGINDRFSLEFGDKLLCDVALRLRDTLPFKNLYRYSGDEFAYICANPKADFNDLIKGVSESVCRPFNVNGNEISVDLIYARTDFPEFGGNSKEIISAMDYSVSSVKKNFGQTNFFYDSSICEMMKRKNYIIERLKDAISNDGFEIHYQGIYCSCSKNFPLAEGLIRFKNKEGEPFVSPGEFIPIAEETGLITKITYIVLEKICSDYTHLMNLHGEKLSLESISINFPYVMFLSRDTVEDVDRILAKYKIPKHKIKMELTERTLVSDVLMVESVMQELIEHGFEFELDDFGVEYSNLSLFFNLPVKIIKFDRSLVLSSTSDEKRRQFFEYLLKSIKALDYKVVMEGVEDKVLLDYLAKCGCDYIQGYVFTKPLPRDEFGEFLMKNNS